MAARIGSSQLEDLELAASVLSKITGNARKTVEELMVWREVSGKTAYADECPVSPGRVSRALSEVAAAMG